MLACKKRLVFVPVDDYTESFAPRFVGFDTAGTLLQVLELLLATRASTSSGDGQLSKTTNDATGKSKSPAHAGLAVLRLLWLADPVKSQCPPIRYAMLQVLQVAKVRVSEDTRWLRLLCTVLRLALVFASPYNVNPNQAQAQNKPCFRTVMLVNGCSLRQNRSKNAPGPC